MTLHILKQVAKSYSAKVVFDDYCTLTQSTLIEIESPDGMKWIDTDGQILTSRFYSYDPKGRHESYKDLIERMKFGLEKMTEEDY